MMMSGEGEGKVVCVTGASGFIASWLVKLLLQRGYTVNATVRDPNSPRTKHFGELEGTKERLHLFKANLLEEGSFDSAVDGCVGVFHVASPVVLSSNNPQADIVETAVKGTLNVLRSCAKVRSIKRVVLTSSIAAMTQNGNPMTPDVVIDETWFSSSVFCKENKKWYPLAKTLAEEAAWKFARENGIDLVAINPGIVIGPFFHPILNFGADVILNLINGAQSFPSPYRFVDIRDVAYAQIQALEVPTANGRYLLVGSVVQLYDILKFLHEHYPTLLVAGKFDAKYEPTCKVSQERAKSLGINFTPWEVGVRDTVESLKEKGFLSS
ncbi:Epimerase domain-containing protein [Citrus sinensis]|uniref:Epimerase domain-containing protein n=1 Tax=Citrus sinensis TaxID=2711 RepID=A0ACB8LLQ5_CITSI|nr:Epimerase domain-containing protein [Citrus sinensis]